MPPQRTPLRDINGNRLRNYELNPYERGQIISRHKHGHTVTDIADTLDYSRKTVFSIIVRDTKRCEGKSKARINRPQKYIIRDERAILRHIRLFLKYTYIKVLE